MADSTQTFVRNAGPYTVTTDGERWYVDGRQAFPAFPVPAGFAVLLDSGREGANGKRDLIGLKPEHVAVHEAVRAERSARAAALPANQRRRLVEALDDVCEQAREEREDAIEALVETGRARLVKDRSAEISAARAALAAFDAAHPEVAAAVEAERNRRADDALAAVLNA